MATELGQAYVQIVPSAKGISGKIQSAIGPEASIAGQSAGTSLGSSLVKAVKGVIVAAGIGKVFSTAISEGAALQQSLGGIETLFKGSAEKVKEFANEAYRTTGLSANAYMENVTGFSASLLQSLGGDTEKAADVANMAMIDMSDNANKMGTSMDRIQDAYQGFAKQNYTMLDNLKLGYGGTKTEMERLLADAEKLTGIKYDINNLSDVYQAIHAIQENLNITGTTAKEAASTFSGSFSAMKAAAQNVLGKLALGEDIMPSLKSLAETTSTFLFKNFIPMVGNILQGLPTVIGMVLKEGIASVFGDEIAKGIIDKVYDIYTNVAGVLSTLYDMIFGSLSKKDNIDFLTSYLGIDESTASQIVNIGENIRVIFENIGATIGNISEIVGEFVGDILGIAGSEDGVNLLGSAFETATGFIRSASEKLKQFTDWLKDTPIALDSLKSAVVGITTAWTGYKAVVTVIKGVEALRNATLAITNGLMLAQFVKTGALTAAEAANAAATMGASGAFGIFNAVLSANPIGLVVTAIAALTAGLAWFFTQTETGKQIWTGFMDWAKQAWQNISDFFVGIWKGISSGAINIWNGVVSVWNTVVESVKNVWNGVSEFFTGLWTGIQTIAINAWNMLTQTIMSAIQPFIDGFINTWNSLQEGLSQMWEGIKMVFQGAWEFIKSIVLGAILIVIDLITGNFTQLGADLGLIWDGITNAISMIWEGIKTYFMGVVNAIVGFGQSMFENFSNILSGIWDFIRITASVAWEWIKNTVIALINGLVEGAQGIWNGFMGFLSGLWEGIKSTAINGWETLKSGVISIINGLIQGAQNAWNSLTQGVQSVVDGVTNIFNSLSNINLFDIGKAILDGFLNGLKGAWKGVTDFVGGIAGWIRDHKGPIEYDRKLLIPHGRAIMDSLDDGLRDKFKDVKQTVGGMAGDIAGVFGNPNLSTNIEFDKKAMSDSLSIQSIKSGTAMSEFQKLSTKVDELVEKSLDIAEKALERPLQMVLDDDTLVAKTGDKFTNWQNNNEIIQNRMRGVII